MTPAQHIEIQVARQANFFDAVNERSNVDSEESSSVSRGSSTVMRQYSSVIVTWRDGTTMRSSSCESRPRDGSLQQEPCCSMNLDLALGTHTRE